MIFLKIKDMFIKILSKTQNLLLFSGFDDREPHIKSYKISTSRFGLGEERNSFCTPRGLHIVRAMIGRNSPINTHFVGRRVAENSTINQDPITSRIIWLSGLEIGFNRLGNRDTMSRYIYIHGTPYENQIGKPVSIGCIRMKNVEVLELFELIFVGTKVLIT